MLETCRGFRNAIPAEAPCLVPSPVPVVQHPDPIRDNGKVNSVDDSEGAPLTKVLILDADGVIQWPRKGWLLDMERRGGLGFVREAFAAETTTLTGKRDLRELIDGLLNERGRPCSPEDILQIWYEIETDNRMLTLVERVRAQGVMTVLATNQQSYRGSYMRRHLPYDDYFDAQFYSWEIGLAKPDPAYFQHIIDVLEIEPQQAVFVDDRPENVAGALEVGLRGEVFAWSDTFGQLRANLRNQGVPGL